MDLQCNANACSAALPPVPEPEACGLLALCKDTMCCLDGGCRRSYGAYDDYLKSRGCDKEVCKVLELLCTLVNCIISGKIRYGCVYQIPDAVVIPCNLYVKAPSIISLGSTGTVCAQADGIDSGPPNERDYPLTLVSTKGGTRLGAFTDVVICAMTGSVGIGAIEGVIDVRADGNQIKIRAGTDVQVVADAGFIDISANEHIDIKSATQDVVLWAGNDLLATGISSVEIGADNAYASIRAGDGGAVVDAAALEAGQVGLFAEGNHPIGTLPWADQRGVQLHAINGAYTFCNLQPVVPDPLATPPMVAQPVEVIELAATSPSGQTLFSFGLSASSRRYKTDITPIPADEARKLLSIGPCSFAWKSAPGSFSVGLIAEEAAEHAPRGVATFNKQGEPESIDYKATAALLVGIVKDNSERIAKLESSLALALQRLEHPRPRLVAPSANSKTRRFRGTRRRGDAVHPGRGRLR
jgi:hypothetical protein